MSEVKYHRVGGPEKLRTPLDTSAEVEVEARRCYGERAQLETYTDEVHVYLLRPDGKRRDFIASYQADVSDLPITVIRISDAGRNRIEYTVGGFGKIYGEEYARRLLHRRES